MPYKFYEIPSPGGEKADIIFADPSTTGALCYTHYAYAVGSDASINKLRERRGIPLDIFRNWEYVLPKFPELRARLAGQNGYYPGESALGSTTEHSGIKTIMRLGALEILANIFSGRVTAGGEDHKDPFPHQLALQQYMNAPENKVKRLLIADEVGLGKTIEVGLILRDILFARGSVVDFSCLYLTKGGLLDDVKLKLKSIISGADAYERPIVRIEESFRGYGTYDIDGIRIASIDAARRCVRDTDKESLPQERPVTPEILIIDECHHCGSSDDLSHVDRMRIDANQTYKAVYQMITGKFWPKSEPPKLVILMSATPFRSRPQFVNLLRLLTHEMVFKNAYSSDVVQENMVEELKKPDSPVAVVWRQQEDVHNWSGGRLFPNLKIERPAIEATEEYLRVINDICGAMKRISSAHGRQLRGFAIRQLEIRLTSSSLAAACAILRWCVRHQKWSNEEYERDQSDSTKRLRNLILSISQRLAAYEKRDTADVSFLSDGFTFTARSIGQGGRVPELFKFNEKLRDEIEEDDNDFIATPEEVIELADLSSRLLNFSNDGTGAENAKLNWLRGMLEKEPASKFLVFTESLQTCEIITKVLAGKSVKLTGGMNETEREEAVRDFRKKQNIRVMVATSAADEGFDFQIANRVVHWDLSPSPAILMQRNGRVARLGQVSDVIAYYLIIKGTHEQRRNDALLARFGELGISDENMRLKILGTLSNEDEEAIWQAVEENRPGLIEGVLKKAKEDNEEMQVRLKSLQRELHTKWVIDRNKLADRLELWGKLSAKLPQRDKNSIELSFGSVNWERPVFGEVATMEPAVAKVATIHGTKVTFDPEFKVFAQNSGNYRIAGLRPWVKKEDSHDGETSHRPFDGDPIGKIAEFLSRQRNADFTTIQESNLYSRLPNINGARFILFATHPMREVETDSSDNSSGYLTFYAFGADIQEPLNPHGASADDVHKLILLLEECVSTMPQSPLAPNELEKSRQAGRKIDEWLQRVIKMGGLWQQGYFLPVPVALVAVS